MYVNFGTSDYIEYKNSFYDLSKNVYFLICLRANKLAKDPVLFGGRYSVTVPGIFEEVCL